MQSRRPFYSIHSVRPTHDNYSRAAEFIASLDCVSLAAILTVEGSP